MAWTSVAWTGPESMPQCRAVAHLQEQRPFDIDTKLCRSHHQRQPSSPVIRLQARHRRDRARSGVHIGPTGANCGTVATSRRTTTDLPAFFSNVLKILATVFELSHSYIFPLFFRITF